MNSIPLIGASNSLPFPVNFTDKQKSNEMGDIDILKLKLANKREILAHLEEIPLNELWDYFLKNQVDLYFEQETGLFSQDTWWQKAQTVLEMGSGNGEYLARLAQVYKNKSYLGVEKKGDLVKSSSTRFPDIGSLSFIESDAEGFSHSFVGKYDVVIFRLTLQHLQKLLLALEYASHYLKPKGCLLIIDTCDAARKTSHPTLYLDEAVRSLNEKNRQQATGNRLITLQILKTLKDNEEWLAQNFDILFTNLDEEGNAVLENKQMLWQNQKERTLYFNHALHFLEILKKGI